MAAHCPLTGDGQVSRTSPGLRRGCTEPGPLRARNILHAGMHGRTARLAMLVSCLLPMLLAASLLRAADLTPGDLFADGYRHLTGQGTPRDATWAAKLFLEAAQAGEPQAQYQLGVLYMDGLGVPKDLLWGYYWLTRACESPALPEEVARQGRGRIEAIKRELTPDQKRRLGLTGDAATKE